MDGSSAEAAAHRYQSFFPDVAGVSSQDLLRDSLSSPSTSTTSLPNWNLHGHNVLLVDVRTDLERDVSMISGAVSLDEFKANVLPSLESKLAVGVDDDSALPDMIVTYCTIGYRSGMEARKLMLEHPNLFVSWNNDDSNTDEDQNGTTMVGNLDGIVVFANASLDYESRLIPIIDRKTNEATNKVHVYGPSWKKYLSHTTFETIAFSRIEFASRGLYFVLCFGRSGLSCNTSFSCCKR